MKPKITLLMVLATSIGGAAQAGSDVQGILQAVRDRPDGRDIYSETKLILADPGGSVRERDLYYLQKDYPGEDRITLYFRKPGDVKGVGFQSINYAEDGGKDDEQWLYLPAYRQVRRIATGDKRGSFMGSEYAYIDLDKLRIGDYTQSLVGSETIDGRDCHVIERIPVSDQVITKTGYHKTVLWVDKERHLVLKQSYYDAAGVHFKELIVVRTDLIQGVWTVMESVMTDRLSGKRSTLVFDNVHYDIGLSDDLFRQRVLETGVHDGSLPALH